MLVLFESSWCQAHKGMVGGGFTQTLEDLVKLYRFRVLRLKSVLCAGEKPCQGYAVIFIPCLYTKLKRFTPLL